MSAKRSKLIRKIALAKGPFQGEVEYKETGKHYKRSLRDLMSVNSGVLVSDPVQLTDKCYRKMTRNVKRNFAALRDYYPGAANKAIADMLLPA